MESAIAAAASAPGAMAEANRYARQIKYFRRGALGAGTCRNGAQPVTTRLEIGANAVNAISIVLAARNSIHTWWTGIIGCLLFGLVFFRARLYADTLLQLFFIATSAVGWRQWLAGGQGKTLPVTHVPWPALLRVVFAAIAIALAYGYLLWRFTNAFAPFLDSLILTLAVAAQLLLMNRKYESWWFWLTVNTLSVSLFAVRGLWITAALYTAFWINAALALVRWRGLVVPP
jgi:nicotinamide mononucleotide transporter